MDGEEEASRKAAKSSSRKKSASFRRGLPVATRKVRFLVCFLGYVVLGAAVVGVK